MIAIVAEASKDSISARQGATRSGLELVPSLVREAGAKAIESYLCFFASLGSKHTGYVYRAATKHFFRWAEDASLSLDGLRAGHVESFFSDTPWKASTVSFYFHSLKKLFAHLETDHIVERSPFAALPAPNRPKRKASGNALKELKEFLLELDRIGEGSTCYRPGLVAMFPVIIGGMDLMEISAATEIPLEEVQVYATRLRENGIWTPDNKVAVDFEDPEKEADLAVVNMVLIIGCAAGVFQRFTSDGKPMTGGAV